MKFIGTLALLVLGTVLLVLPAAAADQRCNAPPYGGTVNGYKSFVEHFGQIVTPAHFLGGICQAKYDHKREGLYNLGFTDGDIDTTPEDELAGQVLLAIKKLADKVP